MADAAAGAGARPAAGVLPFRERAARPAPPLAAAPGGSFAKPADVAPKRPSGPAQPPPGGANPELNEMEIPTFIRRQMD
jgi:hypothetical protein